MYGLPTSARSRTTVGAGFYCDQHVEHTGSVAGRVADLLTSAWVGSLGQAETLDALADNQRVRNLADFRDLELIAHHCALNSTPDTVTGDAGRPRVPGCETMIHPGGLGTPRLREFAVADIAVRVQRGHDSTRWLIADILDLRFRLPKIWRRLAAGEVEVWRARSIARATHTLSVEAAGFVDDDVAPIADAVGPKWLDRIVQAAVIRADLDHAHHDATETDDRQVSVSTTVRQGRTDVFIRADTADVIGFTAAVDFIADLLGLDGDPDPKRIRRSKAIGVIADPNAVLELFARTRTSPPPDVETAIAYASDEDPARLRDLLRDRADRGNRDRSAEPDDDARDVAGPGREPDEVGGDDLDRDGLLVAREPTTDPDEAVGDFDPDILTPELTAAMAEWQAAGWTSPYRDGITDTPRADDAGVLPECDCGRLGGQSRAWTRHPDTDPKTDRLFPRVTLVVHMSQATLFGDTRDPCRLEHPGQASVPLTTEQAVDLLGHSRVTVQPVIDLNHMGPVDGYEIRGRLRQAVFLKSAGVCPFPYCDTFSKYAQCDHTINWPRGPSALGNLAPPDPTHHRLKTHGDWLVQQPFPGITSGKTHTAGSTSSTTPVLDHSRDCRLNGVSGPTR